MTIWIGDIQWRVSNAILPRPTRSCASSTPSSAANARIASNTAGREAEWPEADFIVGNPPFLGGKLMRNELGDDYVETLFRGLGRPVARRGDLVCYWFERRGRRGCGAGERAGLVATNSIRGGANRRVLEPIAATGAIFEAWSDEPWTLEGAAVRVSLVCFGQAESAMLRRRRRAVIHSDLPRGVDCTRRDLRKTAGSPSWATPRAARSTLPGEAGARMAGDADNANGRPNTDVSARGSTAWTYAPATDTWIIDFGWTIASRGCLYAAPYAACAGKCAAGARRRTDAKPTR